MSSALVASVITPTLTGSTRSTSGRTTVSTSTWTLPSTCSLLRKLLEEHPEARLLFFDPLSAYLGGIDSNSNTNVRGVLHTLGNLAKDHDLAIVGIGHFGKGEKRAVDPDARIRSRSPPRRGSSGKQAFTLTTRTYRTTRTSPAASGEEQSRGSAGLSYRISGPRNASVLTWDSRSGSRECWRCSAGSRKRIGRSIKAIDLLETRLAAGPQKVDDIKAEASRLGISEETLRRARRELPIKAELTSGTWYWSFEGQHRSTGPEHDMTWVNRMTALTCVSLGHLEEAFRPGQPDTNLDLTWVKSG